MDLINLLKIKKQIVDKEVSLALSELKETLDNKRLDQDLDYFEQFCLNGKSVRGGLVLIIYDIFNNADWSNTDYPKDIKILAGFYEIIHSALLIHDDIVDNDKLRRGLNTIHIYFKNKYKDIAEKNSDELGRALALDLGDTIYFFGLKYLQKIESRHKSELINFIMDIYLKVAEGQYEDILYGQSSYEPNKNEIYAVYLNKTASYTFILPIISTLILIEHELAKDHRFRQILKFLGILFQISDDLIGFLSDETGKDKGSDIRENKKTIIRKYILKDNGLKKQFEQLIKQQKISNNDIDLLRQNFYRSVAYKKINEEILTLKNKISDEIEKITLPEKLKTIILEFSEFITNRTK
ncbi:MAG: serralysin [Patescibacteria group bacterium]|nr:MAG: serralysin [Patescibacteria group bacterium]